MSVGTERMLVEFARAGWLDKVRQQPDKVGMVLNKMRTDGVGPTIESVFAKLGQPIPLGYCNAGTCVAVGAGVSEIAVGDRVISNGPHAEIVNVPARLCMKIPDAVSDDEAAFTVIGAIALQGIRLVQPTLGEAVVVTGLGLIGLMTVQLLRAHGCRVLGIDYDAGKVAMARSFGAEAVQIGEGNDPLGAANEFSRGRGVDAVIISASTQSNEPVHQAALMCRKRGRLVLVGVTGLDLSRADFYEKELSFQVSCSYGPGRYDPNYEEQGLDYPIGFVRWTEQRNFEAVLDMMATGSLDVKPMISHRFPIAEAQGAYDLVASGGALGILIEYPESGDDSDKNVRRSVVDVAQRPGSSAPAGAPTVSFIGSGNYATTVLIPAFKEAGAVFRSVASAGGVSGVHAARRFGFGQTTTDTPSAIADPHVRAIVITTRHDSHARLTQEALRAGKHVFVEKPLAITMSELADVERAYDEAAGRDRPILMVGFNRRFAPHVQKIKLLLDPVAGPKAFVMTVNAGAVPSDHWVQDRSVGGGRVIGEGCHFIDLLRFLAGSRIVDFTAASIGASPGVAITDDKSSIVLRFEDGSIGTIIYLANGHKSFPKERLEVFAAGRILQLDNFRRLTGFGWPGFSTHKLWHQDKGQKACAAAFVAAVRTGGPAPIPFEELMEVSRVTVEVGEALR